MNNRLWNFLGFGAGAGSLVAQATSTDVAYAQSTGYWSQLTGTKKAQAVLGWLVSRATNGNVTLFPSVVGPVKPQWNIGNALNKYTGIGAVLTAYSVVASHFKLGRYAPMSGKAKKIGVPMIVGGVIGGLLDDPASTSVMVSTGSSGVAPPFPSAYGIPAQQSRPSLTGFAS